MYLKSLLLKLSFPLQSKIKYAKKTECIMISVLIIIAATFSSCKSLYIFKDLASNRCLVIGGLGKSEFTATITNKSKNKIKIWKEYKNQKGESTFLAQKTIKLKVGADSSLIISNQSSSNSQISVTIKTVDKMVSNYEVNCQSPN